MSKINVQLIKPSRRRLDDQALGLILIVGAIVVLLGFMVLAMISVMSDVHAAADNFDRIMRERMADESWEGEQRRLQRKHGDGHVIIYEPQGAHYRNAQGQRCAFL